MVSAKAVIMATPKYITARLVAGLPSVQLEAMRKIRYVPYAVVNLIYDKPVFNKGYDTWCPGNSFTDVIVADWTLRNQPGYSPKFHILSCYTPMREGDRSLFLTDAGTIEVAKNVVRDVKKTLPDTQDDPIEVHIFRRGHPMFMATPGNFTHTLPQVRKPFDRIFFANTDSQGPVSTTTSAIQAAERAIGEVMARIKKA
jgi:protoporphyrinogen oxidase